MVKLEGRVEQYHPYQGFYAIQNRIIITNAFLFSIFAYLCRFFLLSNKMISTIRSVVDKWLIKGSYYTHVQLTCPTHWGGLLQPLRDIAFLNISMILRNRKRLPAPRSQDPYYPKPPRRSMSIQDHLIRACTIYRSGIGSEPPVETTQMLLYTSLSSQRHHLKVLIAKVQCRRNEEKYIGPYAAEWVGKRIHSIVAQLPRFLPSK